MLKVTINFKINVHHVISLVIIVVPGLVLIVYTVIQLQIIHYIILKNQHVHKIVKMDTIKTLIIPRVYLVIIDV